MPLEVEEMIDLLFNSFKCWAVRAARPFYPQEADIVSPPGMSVWCQDQTHPLTEPLATLVG
jgi:hypothetical protein